ncbi:MAG: BhlA/UviB family holin-like peptide [Spirochaetales bacterium]
MWEQIFDLAIGNGLWAALFVGLLIFELKDSNKREKKYQETIKDLNEHLGTVKDIKTDVKQIKHLVLRQKY